MTIGFAANAQYNDNFFRNWDNGSGNRADQISGTTPALPGTSQWNNTSDASAPLGSGLLILTALGAGYAVARKKK